jgi:uncharacterized lipoprotein
MIKIILGTGCTVWLILLASCSVFPDKEEQYKQNSELPPLELPADLKKEMESDFIGPAYNQVVQQDLPTETSKDSLDNTDNDTDNIQLPILVDIILEPVHIEFFDGYDQTWRTVGKVLAHMGLEVLDRDEDSGQYYVVYEEALEPVEDGLWSFLAFWRDENQFEEYDFRVKLIADENSTRVMIMDADEQPVVNGPGRKLLLDIYQAL